MKKGILIYALGHSNYYAMAVVLAASIKVNDPELKICLVSDSDVNSDHAKLFDIVIPPLPKSITQKGNIELIKSKLFMYEHSPFKETIFLDADQVMINDRSLMPVFDELAAVDITLSNTGPSDQSVWCEISEVQQLYGDKPFWNYHSEFVYFKKCKTAKSYFSTAQKVYSEAKIKSATRFANATMADELAFQCAAIITGIYPHKENWTPNFWFDRDHKNSRKYPYELTNYLTYSIGGNSVPDAVKINYNNLAKHYFAIQGLSNPYQVVDKRFFLPERMKI